MPRHAEYHRIRNRQADRVYELLSEGKSDEEIRAELEISEDQLAGLRERMNSQIGERLKRRAPEQVYLEYVIHQRSCMALLDEAIGRFRLDRAASGSIVQAIRARSDIYDKTIKFGQELGLVKKMPDEKRIIGGILVTQLSDDQLRNAIADQVTAMQKMVSGFGGSGEKQIVDMPAGDLHYSLPEPVKLSQKQGKTNRAQANKVHGGRRVIKERVDP